MQRIGVFVCHCGSNIAATVDVKKVVELAAKEPGVVHAEDYQYMCSEAGQAKIQEAIKEKNLTGVVVCSCSPRMHEATFRKAAERAGLNPYMVEIANIREHCSWIHKDMEEATKKAVILARAAIAKVNLNTPLQPGESRVTKRALIIGGGIAGIQTALDIADAGYEVDIDLPGFKKDEVKVALKDGYLTVSAAKGLDEEEDDKKTGRYIRRERYAGACERSFYVGEDVTQEDIKGEYKHGILKLFVPKKEAKPVSNDPKYITIE